MLPNEQEFVEHVSQELAEHFEITHQVLSFGLSVTTERRPTISRSHFENQPMRHLMGRTICVKAIKSLRGSIASAAIGDGDALQMKSRMMFETLMAACFVSREAIDLGKRLGSPDAEFRAKLYFASGIIKRRASLDKLRGTPGCERVVADLERLPGLERIGQDADMVIAGIGDEWTNRLQSPPGTYSGLQIKQLVAIAQHWWTPCGAAKICKGRKPNVNEWKTCSPQFHGGVQA